MKTATVRFLERLIASMPIESIRKPAKTKSNTLAPGKKRGWVGKDETLHRIFMARYRVQHL